MNSIATHVDLTGAEVEAYVSANTIGNSTERTINIYQVGGQAYVERNVKATSTIVSTANIKGVGQPQPIFNAIVVANDVNMEAPESTVLR